MATLLEQRGAMRTRQLMVEIAKCIDEKDEPDQKTIDAVAGVFQAGGLERRGDGGAEPKNTTKILLFLDKGALPELVQVFKDNWIDLTKAKDETKEAARDKVGKILFEAVKAPDIALFGRMLEVKSSTPFGKYNMRVEAACQVAHPISTHKVDMEMDFYTAVDDLNPAEETGAGMMGVVGFNSACYYRYALVDRDQLARNLARKTERKNGKWAEELVHEDYQAADTVIQAFLEAMVYAIPTGKKNSFAPQNLPSFGLFVRRRGGVPISLANAFAKPVRPSKDDDDLIGLSVDALTRHWDALDKVYGGQGVEKTACFHIEQERRLNGLSESDKKSVAKAIEAVMEAPK
jgi:CRISPR system Cascade subunit CasC